MTGLGWIGQLALVGAGGFLGSIARFLVSRAMGAWLGQAFPWGTFTVNVTGSFALGLAATLVAEKAFHGADAIRLLFAVGFVGAYTTFSTFELETHQLLRSGEWLFALGNILGSVAAGFIALRIGVILARMM